MHSFVRKGASALVALALAASAAVAAPDFEALGRDTVSELAAGAFEKVVARFDQKMAASLPREKLAAAWDTVVDQAGPFRSITSVRLQDVPAQGLHVVMLTSAFEYRPVNIQIAFRDDESVAGLYFLPVKAVAERASPPRGEPMALANGQ